MRDYGRWRYRAQWGYTLAVVALLLLPVFYTIYISFNALGFGAARYEFSLIWYASLLENREILESLRWTALLGGLTVLTTVPMALLAAKFYQRTRFKVGFVILVLLPLFVPGDILAASLLVYFKTLDRVLSAALGVSWFRLSLFTALIGQILWTLPYAFVVILITMGRFPPQQTEAARSCGASAWQAFRQVEFPQIRAGVFSACTFVFILSFNEYSRTNFLKGGFDTFTTYLVAYMLNTGMSPEVYAMASAVSVVSMVVVGVVILTMLRASRADGAPGPGRAAPEPALSGRG